MPRPALSRSSVDRAARHRTDPGWLAAAWERALVVTVEDGRTAVDGAGGLLLLDAAAAPTGERYFLGEDAGRPYFAVAGPLPDGPSATLRDLGAALSDRDAGLLAHAVGLANWHAAHPCCSRCGAATEPAEAGAVRRCTADGTQHFPRTDPAVIMLVHDGADRVVLGRAASWPPGRYSVLAGFVEPGESLEQAVAREVLEEVGLQVRDVRYVASQPWPFPSSLMLGFTAVATPETLTVDPVELEDARWFHRDELADGVLLPPPVSIARLLLDDWLGAASAG